jgi:ferredoxin
MFLLSSNAYAAEFIDGPKERTIRQGMHSCPVGAFIVGIHVDGKKLLCSNSISSYSEQDERVNYDIIRQGMHACPKGSAMTGVHVDRRLLSCAPVPQAFNAEIVDHYTIRNGMHACPEDTVAAGIHVDDRKLLCMYKKAQ